MLSQELNNFKISSSVQTSILNVLQSVHYDDKNYINLVCTMYTGKVREALQSLNKKEPNKTLHYVKCKSLFNVQISKPDNENDPRTATFKPAVPNCNLGLISFNVHVQEIKQYSKKNSKVERTKFSIEVLSV